MSVTVTGLGHTFDGAQWLFRGLTHEFKPGALTALTGPSGSGKSTLLHILAGWLQPAEGTVVGGDRRIIWVSQHSHGSPQRTTVDHAALPMLARGADVEEADLRGRELLAAFGLGARADARYRELSGGEAQRLMLARAIAAEPGLLLVDEPTAQLDRSNADTVCAALGALAREDVVAIVATHDPGVVDACDSVLDIGAIRP